MNVDSTYSVYKVFAPAAHLFFFFTLNTNVMGLSSVECERSLLS